MRRLSAGPGRVRGSILNLNNNYLQLLRPFSREPRGDQQPSLARQHSGQRRVGARVAAGARVKMIN